MNHSRQGFIVHKLPKPKSAAQGQELFMVCLHTAVYILYTFGAENINPPVPSTSSVHQFSI